LVAGVKYTLGHSVYWPSWVRYVEAGLVALVLIFSPSEGAEVLPEAAKHASQSDTPAA
jgi:hypothetical protein